MGFDNPPSGAVAPVESLAVKISHGNEIRRVTLQQVSYSSLVENVSSLFVIPQTGIVLKYEDDDGDKISMSSDAELREALRLSQITQKILRLYVELKAPAVSAAIPQQPVQPTQPVQQETQRDYYFGPQQGRGFGFGGRPHGHRPFAPHHHPYGPGHHHPHPHPPHAHPFGAFSHHDPSTFAPQQQFASTEPSAPKVSSPSLSQSSFTPASEERSYYDQSRRNMSQSYFGPQSSFVSHTTHTHSNNTGSWSESYNNSKKAYKESMRMMRDQWKEMKKSGNISEEDKQRFKELKHEIRSEMRDAKKDAMKGMKELKLCDKKQRFVARHVEDVTIPDGTQLPPNTPFVKTWKVRNEGPTWPPGSQLLFISHKGDNLNGPERVVIQGEVVTGQELEVSVPLITPSEPGRYVGYYRMATPDGVKFGQRVWVSFFVVPDSKPVVATTEVAKACNTVDM